MNFRYKWGFETYRTKHRYGLGIEITFHQPLVAFRIGSLFISFGKQVVWDVFTTATGEAKCES